MPLSLPSCDLPRDTPLISTAAMEAILSQTPAWVDHREDPADGSEARLSNAHRCPIDYLTFSLDRELDPVDATAIRQRGWMVRTEDRRVKDQEMAVTVYQHRRNGAMVVTYPKRGRIPGRTTIQFCPGRVAFGRNDRIADVTEAQVATMVAAYTGHLMPATTERGWSGLQVREFADGDSVERQRDRRFLVWTLQRIDLCIQAPVHAVSAYLAAYRLATTPRAKERPLLRRRNAVVHGPLRGNETGLTFGVPAKHLIDYVRPEDRIDLQQLNQILEELREGKGGYRQRAGRVSLTFYDKGAYQQQAGARTTSGNPLPPGRFLRFEVRFSGLDACAGLMKWWTRVEQHLDPAIPVLVRRKKEKVRIDEPHAVWHDLSFEALHMALQGEVLAMHRHRLPTVKVKGNEEVRPYADGWFDELPDVQRSRLWRLARGTEDAEATNINGHARSKALELALSRKDLPGGPRNLFWALWPYPRQHLTPAMYDLLRGKVAERRVDRQRQELELVMGPRPERV